MKHFYLLLTFAYSVCFCQTTPPSELQEYYQDVDFSKTADALYEDLATLTIVKHSTFLTYSQRHEFLYEADEDGDNPSNVVLVYTGESRDKDEYLSGSNSYSPQTFNTEHLYPRSLVDNTAEADLHHLRPCDIDINSQRANLPFVSGSGNYGKVGEGWYPGDDWRGDVARSIMYMNLRYNETFEEVGSLSIFLDWNAADPVSALEIQRNEVISNVQGNRNPFIDNPYLATLVWSGPTAENRWATLSTRSQEKMDDFKIYPNPVSGTHFFIKVDKGAEIYIYNVLGKLVKQVTTTSAHTRFDVSTYQRGVYLIKVKTADTSFSRKLILK